MSKKMMIFYSFPFNFLWKSLMTLMTLTLMTAFHVSSATFNAYFPVLQCFCNKVLIENDRKYYLSATYAIFSIES